MTDARSVSAGDASGVGVSGGGVSVIVRAGDYESVHYGLALAAAALAVNKPAVLFFTMAGIRALSGPPPQLDDWARDADNRARGVGDFETLLQACVELGARFIVCEMGLRSLAIDRASLRADVPFTVAGIVTLLEETRPGMHLVSL
jgi:peroxiredoxin family protein